MGRVGLCLSLSVLRGVRKRERHMRYFAGCRDGLDSVVLLRALEPVPEPYTAAEQNRDHDDVHVIDRSGSENSRGQ